MVLALEESRYWDAVAEAWHEAHPQTLWRVHSDAVNCRLLTRWLPGDRVKRLLKTDAFDEAFGAGLYPLLTLSAESVIDMDVSVSTLRLAQAHYASLCTVGADARRLPFANCAFDCVVSTSTLDHFHSRDELLASLHELRRVLQPAGQLLLTLDNPTNPLIALRNVLPFRSLNRLGFVPYYVGATCGPLRLRRLLAQVGFEVLEVSAVMHCPRAFAVAMARVLDRYTALKTQRRFLRALMAFERLSRWPTRFLTGHFVAVRAMKH